MNIISILIGLMASPIAFAGMIPFLGWMNWLMIPVAVLGAIIGAFAKNKAGLTINLIVLAVGVVRLMLGGGFL